MRKKLYNKLISNYTLNLVIGEDIPKDVPNEFHTIKLYIREENNNLKLYDSISLPYLINHSQFLDIEDDPRYIFKEGYDPETGGSKYTCMLKPLGTMKGVYRILGMNMFKIGSVEPLFELNDKNVNKLIKMKK